MLEPELNNLGVVSMKPREVVLRALKLNGPMTAIQLSKLQPQNRKGEVSVYQPNPKRRVFQLRSYMNVHKLLKRWENEDWKVLPQRKNDADVWIPVELRKRFTKPNQDDHKIANLAHELAVSDVYSVLYPHLYPDNHHVLEYWDRDRSNPGYDKTKYDARLTLLGKPMFLEVERGNHPILSVEQKQKAAKAYLDDSLNYKFDRYIQYYNDSGYQPFTVLITVEDWSTGSYDPEGTERLFERIVGLLRAYVRGDSSRPQVKFLIARHRDVIGDRHSEPGEIHNEVMGDPLGQIWFSPLVNQYVTLKDV